MIVHIFTFDRHLSLDATLFCFNLSYLYVDLNSRSPIPSLFLRVHCQYFDPILLLLLFSKSSASSGKRSCHFSLFFYFCCNCRPNKWELAIFPSKLLTVTKSSSITSALCQLFEEIGTGIIRCRYSMVLCSALTY